MKKQRLIAISSLIAVILFASVMARVSAQSQTTWRTIGNSAATGQFVGTTDNSALSLKTNNIERLLIKSNGGLKVSSLAGTQPSVVAVTADGSLLRYDPSLDSTFDCSTKLYRATGNYLTPNCFIGSTNKAPFRVFTNNTQRMHFMETGNIGIGTVTPQTPFHVYSSANAELRVEGSGQGVYPMLGMWVGNGSQGVALADIRAGIASGTANSELYIELNDGAGVQSMKKVMRLDALNAEINVATGIGMSPLPQQQLSVNGSIKLIQPATPANSLRFGHNGTNATIDATGANSGIVLTTPNGTATIQQSGNASNLIRLGHNGTNATVEAVGANSGISLSSPSGTTTIQQSANATNTVKIGHNGTNATLDAAGGSSGFVLSAPSGTTTIQQSANTANYLKIGHDGTTAILQTGNGANTKLIVNGNGSRTDFGGTVLMTQNLGLGTLNFADNSNGKTYRLSVDGRIRCNEVKVYSGWADHVFGADYHLMPLAEVEAYIAAHGHLPGLPSATDVARDGVDVGATQALLLEKIEELTLHLIRLEKENVDLRNEMQQLK